jgi:hypothetical protein
VRNEGAAAAIAVRRGKDRLLLLLDAASIGDPRRALETVGRARLTEEAKAPAYWVFGAPYVSERTADLCKRGGVGYIDLAGNFHIDAGPFLLSARGNTGVRREKKTQQMLFSPKASRVSMILLLDPEARWTQRSLAGEVGISLGLVNRTLAELARQRFTAEEGGKWRLADKEGLLTAWAREYAKRPRVGEKFQAQSTLEDLEARLDRDAAKQKYRYALTREAAAKYRAPFAPAPFLAFYCDQPAREVAERLGLKPAEFGGTVEILEPPDEGVFFRRRRVTPGGSPGEETPGLGRYLTNDIYLYLDLWANPARGKEQAEHLLETTADESHRRRSTEEEVRFREFLKIRDKAHLSLREGKAEDAVATFERALGEIRDLKDEQARESRERENFFYGLALERLLRDVWDKDPAQKARLLFKLRCLVGDEQLLDLFPPFRMNHALVRYFLGARRAILAAASRDGEQDHEARVAVQHFKIAVNPYTEGANTILESVESVREWLRKTADIDLDLG